MTTTYCTSSDVAKLIWRNGDGSDFSATTNPTKSFVEELINAAEDDIDNFTHHAWRSVLVSDEIHDLILDRVNYRRWWGYYGRVHLNHRKIREFISGTHKIEIWDGSDWVDLVLDANGYTEGRDDDYWIDYEKGIIYFVNTYPHVVQEAVKVTYAYGDTVVPSDIKLACMRMVGIDLVMQDDRSILLPEGSDNVRQPNKVEIWQAAVEKTLEKYMEIVSA